ncbi:MAG: diamine N-acetyltransferase [Alteromonadaceae bacterium]|jgi:diamine N-acetyltransferase
MDIYVREIEKRDLKNINKWRSNKNTVNNLGSPFRFINEDTDVNWFENYMSSRSRNVRLAICDSSNDELIGSVYLLSIDWINRSAEISIWIGDEKCRGKMVGFKAMSKMLTHAFCDLNLHRIYLTVLEKNERAINLYKKIGFLDDGFLRDAVYKNGQYHNMYMMSLLRTEYNR